MAGILAAIMNHEVAFRREAKMQNSEQKGRNLHAYGWQLLLSGSTFFYMRGEKVSSVLFNLTIPSGFWC